MAGMVFCMAPMLSYSLSELDSHHSRGAPATTCSEKTPHLCWWCWTPHTCASGPGTPTPVLLVLGLPTPVLVVLGSPTPVLVVPGHPTPVLLVLTPPTPLLVVCASRTVLAVLGPLCPLRAPLVCAHCVRGHPALRAPRLALLLPTHQLQESTTGQSTAMEGHQEDTDAAGQGSGVK